MELHDKLLDIQQNLQVPKTRENAFGGFTYRNIEDIEDKIKPLLVKHKLTLRFNDEIIAVGERVYVKATAILSDGKSEIKNSANAREAEKPKAKTDDAQLTGGTSSYARKYAAQGLFLIDDGKGDPDNPNQKEQAAIGAEKTSQAKQKVLKALTEAGYEDSTEMIRIIEIAIGKSTIDTVADADKVVAYIKELSNES